MRARSSPYRGCGERLVKVASQSLSTTSWTHFAPWMPVLRKLATAIVASCESAGFSVAAATRMVPDNLFTRVRSQHVALSIHGRGDRFRLSFHGGSHHGSRGLIGTSSRA